MISNTQYNAADQVTKMTWAGNPTSTYDPDADSYMPFSETLSYNQRNQVTQIQTQVAPNQNQPIPSNGSVIDLNYGYYLGNAQGTNNGQVTSVKSGLDPMGVNSAYQYDQLGQLTSKTGLSGGPSQTFTYDGWGNLPAKSGGQSFSLPIDPASNRIYGPGICYDPNGNLTGAQNGCDVDYGYDMSNRLVSAKSTLGAPERYWYTADNKRVSTLKPPGTAMNGILQQLFYVYGARGELTTCYSKFFGSVPICTPTELKWAGRLIRRTIGFYNQQTSNDDRYSGVPVVTDRVGSVVGIGMAFLTSNQRSITIHMRRVRRRRTRRRLGRAVSRRI